MLDKVSKICGWSSFFVAVFFFVSGEKQDAIFIMAGLAALGTLD